MRIGGAGTYTLGIDFGTSNTAAVLGWPDGRARPLLFDGAPLLPSAVCLDASGALLVGRDALNASLSFPERFEPHPKRRIDDGTLLLGATEVPVGAAVEAVLRRVAAEAQRVAGGPADRVVLTYPASWGARRQGVLAAAAERAGLGGAHLVVEPLAAAFHLAGLLGERLPVGGHLMVYDFGAGTFDASIVRRTGDGFAVVASAGVPDAGGLDVDAAVVAHFGAVYGEQHRAAWRRLELPGTAADRRHSRQLWDRVREAKESLSRTASALIHLPVLELDAPLGRDQLDQLARPVVDRSVAAARGALLDAGLEPADLAAIVLVGGASRMPIVATSLHRAFGIAPLALEQPELVVAEGSLRALPSPLPSPSPSPAPAPAPAPLPSSAPSPSPAPLPSSAPSPLLSPAPAPAPLPSSSAVGLRLPAPADPGPAVPVWRRRPVWIGSGAVAIVVALIVTVVVFDNWSSSAGAAEGTGGRRSGAGTATEAGSAGAVAANASAAGGASGQSSQSGRPAATGTGSGGSARPGASATKTPTKSAMLYPRTRTTQAKLVVEEIGVPMTLVSGSGPTPDFRFSTSIKGRNGWPANAVTDLRKFNITDYQHEDRVVSWSMETHKCSGEKVDGKAAAGQTTIAALVMDVDAYSGSFYVTATLTSFQATLDGVVWKGSPVTVTTACITL